MSGRIERSKDIDRDISESNLNRRTFLGGAGLAVAGTALVGAGFPELTEARAEVPNLPAALPEGMRSEVTLESLPGKKPLIKLSYRPPNYEASIEYFRTAITPNDQFFVRYHLSVIPEIDPKTWKISIGGDGANGETTLSLDELKALPAYEVTVAVNQCSGQADAGCSSRMSRASNGATARSSARAGRARAL